MKNIIMATCISMTMMMLTASCKTQHNKTGLEQPSPVSFGQYAIFNEDWLFRLEDNQSFADTKLDDSKWRQMTLPHDWSIEFQPSQEYASCTGYLPGGIGWYRKHFNAEKDSLMHYIYFEGIYNRSEVYLNGHLLGKRPNGYASFLYDMTPYLQQGDNVLAVRVDHSRYADSRWYTGSGIYRDVWVVTAPLSHFSQWGSAYRLKELSNGQAVVEIDYSVDIHKSDVGKKFEVNVEMNDEDGKSVANGKASLPTDSAGTVSGTICINISNPQLWDINHPYLYTLSQTLVKDGQETDQNKCLAGLRTLEFSADKGFYLNGSPVKVKGVCLHHDAGVLGAVVPTEVWAKRIEALKNMGVNAIRMSHNPQAPVLYDICDKLGMLVMDEASDEWEFPKRKWVEGWNVGQPSYDGTFDFFEEWIDSDVTDMVRRDRNHPCVFLWSIGNEVDYPNDPYSHPILDGTTISQPMFGGYKKDAPDAMRIGKIAKRLAADVRNTDKSRPVTGALAGVVMSNETEYPQAVDVVGYNYTEDRYDIDHEKYPERIIYGSETRSDYGAWKDVRDRQHIFGQFIWTGADYLGESGRWPSRGLYTGLLDFASYPKGRGWFRTSLWSDKPMVYLGMYHSPANMGKERMKGWDGLSIDAESNWNFEEGDLIRVVCYTNADEAELLLNGKTVGERKKYDDEKGMIWWDIPFQAGTISAKGYDSKGQEVAKYEIVTTGDAVKLACNDATPDMSGLISEKDINLHNKVYMVDVEICDKKGNRVKDDDKSIKCLIQGPGKLLGLENCNNSDMSNDRTDSKQSFRGYLRAYIERTGNGNISLTFKSDELKDAKLTLRN